MYLEGLGNALPTYTVTVHTQVNGPLVAVTFKEGQFVHKGDLLAQIDARPYLAVQHQAEAALARDEATLKNAQLDLERYRELRQQKLIAEQQYTAQIALVDTTNGIIKLDQAQIESARLNVEYSRIVSPIDGVTGVRLIDPGNLVQTSDSGGLVVITQLDPMTVLFTLPEDDLPRVQNELAKGPLTVEAYSRDGSHDLATGTLTFIDNRDQPDDGDDPPPRELPEPEVDPLAERVREGAPHPLDREGRHRRAGRHNPARPDGDVRLRRGL